MGSHVQFKRASRRAGKINMERVMAMKQLKKGPLRHWAVAAIWAVGSLGQGGAVAASVEMGVGVPFFGSYSAATGVQTIVWSLEAATAPFPAGCSNIRLTAATMGMDAYKIAVATLLVARTTNRAVRFYAHAERDGGCGVDYVQLN